MNATTSKFDTWALVEIMGHQRAAGRVTEAAIAGGVMLRIDIPKDADSKEFVTQYINTGSVFRLTPVTEEVVRAALTRYEWKPPQLSLAHIRGYEDLPVRDYGDDDDQAACFHEFLSDGEHPGICMHCGAMPGPVSDSHQGPSDEAPFVPSWCYPNGPRMCPCGHHEGYHADEGWCLLTHKCGCQGWGRWALLSAEATSWRR